MLLVTYGRTPITAGTSFGVKVQLPHLSLSHIAGPKVHPAAGHM